MTNPVSDKAQQVLVTLLEKAVAGIDAAVSFSQAQIPDVINQLLVYKVWDYGLTISLYLAVIVTCIWIFKKSKKSFEENNEVGLLGMIVSLILAVMLGLVAFSEAKDLIMLIVAPKLYLIQYAADLMGGK